LVRKNVSLYGTGGHANIVFDTLLAAGQGIHAVFDDRRGDRFFAGLKIRPGLTLAGQTSFDPSSAPVIVCVGHNAARADIAAMLSTDFASVVHPRALVSPDVMVGDGTVIIHGAIVLPGARIGRHVIVNTMAVVGGDCELGDFCHVSPQAALGEGVLIGEGTHVGARAMIAAGVRIGAWSTVGAGAVVEFDVANDTTVVGNPARVLAGRLGQSRPTGARALTGLDRAVRLEPSDYEDGPSSANGSE
jgi:sugar O-acyltransferase (sialic acid O-acetyltransferase NeuD family)